MKKIKLVLAAVLSATALLLSAGVFASDLPGEETESLTERETHTEIKPGTDVKELVKDELNVKAGTMVSNFFSFGTSLSGMTKEETQKTIQETRDAILSQKLHATSADEDKEWEATLEELGVELQSADISEELTKAYLEGSLLTRYKKAKAYEKNPVNLISGLVIDEDSIHSQIQEALSDWNQEVKESTAKSRGGQLQIEEGQYGHEYDFTPGIQKFIAALKEGTLGGEDYELECEYTTEAPLLTPEKIRDFTVIGSCTTYYASPTTELLKSRETNLIVAINNANGRVYAPGEVVSMLDIYGPVDGAHGYASAATYKPGVGHVYEYGGGLCQVASTMYNAALMAELKIVHREPHHYMVAYLPPSLDAMIYAPTKNDFKYCNDSSDCIIIDSYVDRANLSITINIIGHEDHPAGHGVYYYSVINEGSMNMPQSPNTVDTSLKIGFGGDMFSTDDSWFVSPGFVSTSYKVVTENGKVVSTTPLNHDRYNPCNQGAISVPADKYVKISVANGYEAPMYVNSGTNNTYKASFIQMDTYFVGADGDSASSYLCAGKSFNYSDLNEIVKAGMAERGYHGWTAEGNQRQGVAKAIPGAPEPSESESESESEPASEPGSEPGSEPESEPTLPSTPEEPSSSAPAPDEPSPIPE